MNADEFWGLPRSTSPAKIFGEIAAALPVPLPRATVTQATVTHIRGTGGGTWSSRLVDGRLEVHEGAAADPICQVTLERATLREFVAGSLRDRGLEIMAKLGRARQIPDLSRLPVRDDRARALSKLGGSVAIEVHDRNFGETHRIVVTFGGGAVDFERATVTVRVDADQAAGWIASRADARAILKGGSLRIDGDLSLVTRAAALLLDP